jgi:hypothetical protein
MARRFALQAKLDHEQDRSTRCARTCWQARSPAHCDATDSSTSILGLSPWPFHLFGFPFTSATHAASMERHACRLISRMRHSCLVANVLPDMRNAGLTGVSRRKSTVTTIRDRAELQWLPRSRQPACSAPPKSLFVTTVTAKSLPRGKMGASEPTALRQYRRLQCPT